MNKNPQILIICGPTATGKTNLGLKLAQKFNGEIISADSRQVYKCLDIGTGKGIESSYQFSIFNFQNIKIPYYLVNNTKIWGYDLVDPNEEFSVGHYSRLMRPVIEDIISRGKLPIIVGGTGFYINSLLHPPETIGVQPDINLRTELAGYSVEQLQSRLAQLNSVKLNSMNYSDRHNPRRLIRAIETAQSGSLKLSPSTDYDEKWIGLTGDREKLRQNVLQNIYKRLDQDFEDEVHKLMSSDLDWDLPWSSSTGYKIWRRYLNGAYEKQTAIDLWLTQEHQYQKRQITYFKKNKKINWFNLIDTDFERNVVAMVKTWVGLH